jgi:hypothetical protein
MHLSKSCSGLSLVAVATCLLAACAPLRVNSYVGADVAQERYRSYAWASVDGLSTGDPRLDNNTFFIERVQQAVEDQLRLKGLQKARSGEAELTVHYHAHIDQRIDSDGVSREAGRCQAGDCRPYVYDAGTLLLDFVDARSNSLVWRGWAEGALLGAIDEQAWMERAVDTAVTRIMVRFPH